MRFGVLLGACAVMVSTTLASADDDKAPVDVSSSGHTITAKTSGIWHMNSEYPWKVKGTDGDGKPQKITGFTFDGAKAKIENVPNGTWIVHGGVCADGMENGKPIKKCQSFSRSITLK
jgi:hypothetical protein